MKYNIYKLSCEIKQRDFYKAFGDYEEILDKEEFNDKLRKYIQEKELYLGNEYANPESYETLEEAMLYFDKEIYLNFMRGCPFNYFIVEWYELYKEDEESAEQIC